MAGDGWQQMTPERLGTGGGAGGAAGGGGGAGGGALPNERVEPSEDNIVTLMGMGFDREVCVDALATSGNSVEMAANRLLT